MRLLNFKNLPHGLTLEVGVRVRLRPLQAALLKVRIQLAKIPNLGPGNEEAATHGAHLVLHLALLPAGRRRAGCRLKQIMRAQLLETVVEAALLASENLVHRRLQVVVDPPPAYASEKIEGPHVGVKNHLLGLTRVGHHQKMPAVTQPQLCNLHRDRHPRHLHQLVAPVELEGFSRLENQWNENVHRKLTLSPAPIPHMPPYAVIAARIAFCLQLLKKNNRGPALPLGKSPILCQRLLQTLYERAQNWPWLRLPAVTESCLLTANRLTNRVA